MKRIILSMLACLLLSPIGGAFADQPAGRLTEDGVVDAPHGHPSQADDAADDEGGRPADSAPKTNGAPSDKAAPRQESDDAAPIDCSSAAGSPSFAALVVFVLIGLRGKR